MLRLALLASAAALLALPAAARTLPTPAADAAPIVLAQGSGGTDSGGLGGSSPGSPGTGSTGSTPQVLPPTTTQPGQTSASPMAPRNPGVGAPMPGTSPNAPVNQGGNTGVAPGTRAMGSDSNR